MQDLYFGGVHHPSFPYLDSCVVGLADVSLFVLHTEACVSRVFVKESVRLIFSAYPAPRMLLYNIH